MKKNIKELIDNNAADTYEVLRKFYKDVVSGKIDDVRMTKDGAIVHMEPSLAVRVEAANALLRMDIDKVQGNAKAKETDSDLTASSDALAMLSELAAKRKKDK